MVSNLPRVLVSHVYNYVTTVPARDQVFAAVIECNKGTPNEPVLIQTASEMIREFGVTMNAYWGVGGQPIYLTRAVYQGEYDEETETYATPVTKAVHYLWDTSTTSIPVIKLEAAKEGTYEIYFDAGPNATAGNDIVIEEENCATEYFVGVVDQLTEPTESAIQRLVERINDDSALVTAYFRVKLIASPYTERWCDGSDFDSDLEEVVYGSDELELTGRIILGSEGGSGEYENSLGSDGVVKVDAEQSEFDLVPNAYAAESYRDALAGLEDLIIAGVFSLRGLDATTGEIATHVEKMNTAAEHKWRIGIVGAPEDSTMNGMLTDAIALNNENMVYVGQGVEDINGDEYPARMATQVVAGKLGYTTYQYAIWGGNSSKVLGVDGVQYIADILPLVGSVLPNEANHEDLITYNEHGVLTFQSDDDGCRIREGITTAQSTNTSDEDEIAVARIVRHAKYVVYDACYAMLGENISNTFNQDMNAALAGVLNTMKEEGALIDVSTDGLSAFDVSVTTTPRSLQREGRVTVDLSITPVHAARTITTTITVN